MLYIPDSPQGLLARNKLDEAEKSTQFYRNDKNYKLNQLKQQENQSTSIREALKSKSVRRGFMIAIMLTLFCKLCGIHTLCTYSGIIFRDAGSTLSPNMSSFVVTVLELLASLITVILVDKWGRRGLLAFSGFGVALGNTGLGVYLFCQEKLEMDMSSCNWVPLVCFCVSVSTATCGIRSLLYVIFQEIVPARVNYIFNRNYLNFNFFYFQISKKSNMFFHFWCETCDFITLNSFKALSDLLGMYPCMFFFAMCSFGGALFSILVVPETKGKSLEEIEILLTK